MTAYTCTLTRWHKVAERLNKESNAMAKSAKQGLTETNVALLLACPHACRLLVATAAPVF